MSTENKNIEMFEEPMHQKMKYGATELMRVYKKFLTIGMLLTFALFTSGLAGYGVSIIIVEKNKQTKTGGLTTVELQDQNTESEDEDENAPPPDVNTEKVSALKDDAALVPEPVAKERADTTKFKTQAELDKIKTVVSSEGDVNADPNKEFTGELKTADKEKIQTEVTKDKDIKTEKKVYQTFEVEKAPVAVNLSAVRSSMRYPEIAKSSGIEGKVTVKVLVGPDGSVDKVGGISGPDVFHDEVRDKVMDLQFTPALQNGKAVSCWVNVPFSFTLTGKFKKEKEADKEEEKKEENNP